MKLNKEALKTKNSNEPIQIAPNVYLCLSYRYGLYKEGTPGLLRSISQQAGEKATKVTVVSQFPKDLEVARELSLSTKTAHDFYTSATLSPSAQSRVGARR